MKKALRTEPTRRELAARTGIEPDATPLALRQNADEIAHDRARSRSRTVMNCHEKTRRKPIVLKAGNVPVTIYQGQARGYDLFTVVHYSGGRKRETFAKLADARQRAQEIVAAISNGRLAMLKLTNGDCERYIAAMDLLRPLGISVTKAIEEYVEARQTLKDQSLVVAVKAYAARARPIVDRRVREIVNEMLISKRSDGLSVRYIQTIRAHLNRFASAFETTIGAITTPLIDEWLRSQHVGARARNNMRSAIVSLFHFARIQGYLAKGQATEADDAAKAKDWGGKIGILTPSNLATLLEKSGGDIQLFFALGAFTGMRSNEILQLDWKEINFERKHITVSPEKAKTATRRLVPIQPNLMEWLTPYRGSTGQIFRSRRDVDRAIAFAKTLEIEWPNNALRHSYATYRLASIADTARVALEMGNSPQKLMTNYRELADEREAANWFSIAPNSSPANVVTATAFSTAA